MNKTAYIDHILQTLKMPLWGKWEVGNLISASYDSAEFSLESRRMNRSEKAVLKIVPLIAEKAYLTDAQKRAQIERAVKRAEEESNLLYRLQFCPNIVTYQDEEIQLVEADGLFEGYAYLIRTEACDCLTECINEQRFSCTEENVLRLGKELAAALQYAHAQGITHRNIQPDLICLTEGGTAKLSGFHPMRNMGSIYPALNDYIAPEFRSDGHTADAFVQADIYALGLCLYQLMNNMNLPFEPECDPDAALKKRMKGEPLPAPALASEQFAQIILKACAFRPADRYRSAEEMLAALLFPEVSANHAAASAPDTEPADSSPEPAADETAAPESAVPEQAPVQQEPVQQEPVQPIPPEKSAPAPELSAPHTAEPDPADFEIRSGTLIRYRGTAPVVTIPQGISMIGTAAFQSCASVREITLPEGIMRIEELAFADCPALQTVVFPNTLRAIHNKAFMNCTALQNAEFHGVLSQIGMGAFDGCSSLRSVIFDCPIEKIGYDAFSGCTGLQQINVSSFSYSYKTIDGVLFDYECKYLIRYPEGKPAQDYIVPETVFAIEDGAFYGSVHLERVKLSRNVKRIGASAFRDCKKLRGIVFSEVLETIKSAAFQGCVSLKSVNLPAWATYIGTYAFSHCEQLESVTLPAKMTELCVGIFEYCTSLSMISLPENIAKIGEKAFMGSGLTEIFIPYATTKIERQCFAGCSRLQTIFLSNRISQIPPNAFDGCDSALTIFGMQNSFPAEYAADKHLKFERIFTLTSCAGQYALHDYKGTFAHVIIPPDVNVIGEKAFFECKTLRSVVIPSNVGAIEKQAFEGCDQLESVSMTNLIMRIGDHAFAYCKALKQFHISDLSHNFDQKVQRKIHRNYYNVLEAIHPDLAEEYAKEYPVAEKSAFLDLPFSWKLKKESQEHVDRLAEVYTGTPFLNALVQLIEGERQKSERMLMQIELFGDCIMITGVRAGQVTEHKYTYYDLPGGIRKLPDVFHMLACATVIVRNLGSDYALAAVQKKDSAVIRPSIT